MNEVEEVKQRLEIVDLVSQYVTLKKAGANYKGSCPFHQEKTASLMVSPQKQIWKCFGCGKGGDHYAFVMEAEHLEFGDALRMLAQKAGVTLQPRTTAEHQTQTNKERLFRINLLVSRIWQKLLLEGKSGKDALAYLKKRGLTDETIKKFSIGLAPRGFDLRTAVARYQITAADLTRAGNPDKFFDRIMFPITDVLGNVIAFTGRALTDIQPKYINSPETPTYNKGRVWYGLNFARIGIKERDYVVLVEGQMDVIALHQAGATNAVASSGTAITETQLQILSKYTTNFLLAFDADSAGITTTKKVIELLLKYDLNNKVVSFGAYKDAGELLEKDPGGWPEAVKAAVEGVDWWINQEISAAGDIQFIESKKKVIKAMLPVLAGINDKTRLDHYVGRLAAATATKPDSIYASLAKLAPGAVSTQAPASSEKLVLTDEEQLLALLLAEPAIIDKHFAKLNEIVWQSVDAAQIAEGVKTCYNSKTLAGKTPFSTAVKTHLNAPNALKVDSWQFWATTQWPELNEGLASELIAEKIGRLSTKSYERHKENLAIKIRQAQEKGDVAAVKNLLKELNELTKTGA